MAYSGYLIKIIGVSGSPPVDYTFPNSKIAFETYSAKENTLYSDSFQDALGVTNAKALAHKIDKVTFKTVQMTNTEFRAIMNEIEARYTESNSRTLNVEYYVPEKDIYRTASMHITDMDMPISRVNDTNNTVIYLPITFTFTVW